MAGGSITWRQARVAMDGGAPVLLQRREAALHVHPGALGGVHLLRWSTGPANRGRQPAALHAVARSGGAEARHWRRRCLGHARPQAPPLYRDRQPSQPVRPGLADGLRRARLGRSGCGSAQTGRRSLFEFIFNAKTNSRKV
jgi:hypothetical protein